ncbi:hypothetical protein [Mitsuokella jalaludinii]|uniref:hypothetical protein n=1 Tax=Mitsuokella jalaludinii TaxID=187979 RepID=UPI003080A2CD
MLAKYDENGRCIKAGRSTKKLKEKFEKFGEAVLMAFMAVGTAVLLAQFFGVMIGAIDPRP